MNDREIYKRLFRDYSKKYLDKIFLAAFFSIIVATSTSAIAWLLDPAIKKLFLDKDQSLIFIIPMAIIVAFSAKGISLYFAKTTMISIAEEVKKQLQFDMVKSLINADLQQIQKKHSGKFISNLTYDVNHITDSLSTGVLNLFKDGVTLIGLMTVMFFQNWKLSLVAIVMIPIASIVSKGLSKRIKKVTIEAQEKSGFLTTYLVELFKNHKLIKIFQKENYEKHRADEKLSQHKDKNKKIFIVFTRISPIMETLTGFIIAVLIFYSSKLVAKNELDINNFFSFLAAMMLAYQPIRSLATINIGVYQGVAAAKRIYSVLDKKIETFEDNELPEIKIQKCDISFEDISFNYLNTNKSAIKNINLKILGGSTVAFVGHSGAGKTTIINLLPRFYEPKEGKIFIDNQDIHKFSLKSLRKNISLVSQEVILFDSSIKNNVAYADANASDAEIIEACEFAAAHDFINKLPNKYETLIGENGVRLSGGQKQRISIARAILKKAPIILLDEATSSLDTDSEEIVQNAITNLTKNKTTLIVAHRLSTIHNADKIFVLKNGSIINSGNHDFLISNCKEYKSLYEKQLK